MILHFYFARRFAKSFLALCFIFFCLIVLIDSVEQIRKFRNQTDVGLPELVQLTLLNVPQAMNEILPLVVILATILLFINLARSSELVVTRAAGRSALSALMAPVAVALIIGGMTVTLLNPIVAATTNYYSSLEDAYKSDGSATLSISDEGLWLRQGDPQEQTVIHASRASAEAHILYEVTFLTFNAATGHPVRRIEASSAQLKPGNWELRKAKLWQLAPGTNPEANAEIHDTLIVPSSLTLDRIRNSLGTRASISVWDLPRYIQQLERAGFSSRRHQVWYQSELARPLFLVSMVLIASAFTMRHTRFGGTGIAVLTAVMVGFGLYFIRNFALILGENGELPVLLAAWAPPVAGTLLALGLLLHAEDG
jgi:lipopolysaccharide export system permease protein